MERDPRMSMEWKEYPDREMLALSLADQIASELAQQLRRAGREVPLLVVLDAAGPGGRPSVRGWAKLRAPRLRVMRRLDMTLRLRPPPWLCRGLEHHDTKGAS